MTYTQLSTQQLPPGDPVIRVDANPVREPREWHQSVTADFRAYLVQKIVQAVSPCHCVNVAMGKRLHRLVPYAVKAERAIFETANSRSQYYHLITKKIYEIRKRYRNTVAPSLPLEPQAPEEPIASSSQTAVSITGSDMHNILIRYTCNSHGGDNSGFRITIQYSTQNADNPVQQTKEWHQSVTPDHRNEVVRRLLKAIFHSPFPAPVSDQVMLKAFERCQKLEDCLYQKANSRMEYYQLVAQTLSKTPMLSELARQKLKEQQQLQARATQAQQQQPQAQRQQSQAQPQQQPQAQQQQPQAQQQQPQVQQQQQPLAQQQRKHPRPIAVVKPLQILQPSHSQSTGMPGLPARMPMGPSSTGLNSQQS